MLFTRFSWAAEQVESPERHSLVDIFCTVVVEQSYREKPSKKMEDAWPDLERYFESGKLFSLLLTDEQLESEFKKIKNTLIFKKCLDENKKEFEYGEFILSGKKITRDTLQAYKTTSKASLSSASFQLGESYILPSDLSLNILVSESNFPGDQTFEVVAHREKKYNSLWHRFIADVKNRSKALQF